MVEADFDEDAWRTRLLEHRAEKDEFLASDPGVSLPTADRDSFEGLSYFSLDPAFRVVARFQAVCDPESVELPANRGPGIEYERVATLGFPVDGDHHVLAAFRAPGADDLLVPFRDATSGEETARTGRYVTLSVDDVDTGQPVVLDFNLAYHPFCVYDDGYLSVVAPAENELPIAVSAGERL